MGEWFAKTMLLLAHPDRYHDNPVITRNSVRLPDDEVPGQHFYDWLINGQSPPEGLSVWLHRVDLTSQKRPSYCVPLPTVTVDQQTIAFTEFQWGLHGVWAALVVHLGWPIIHPLAEQGFAAPVLPDLSDVVNLKKMPILWPKVIALPRVRLTLKPGVLGTPQLPPLQKVPDVIWQVFPFVEEGGWSF